MKGLVYGDVIGSPFKYVNTQSRYFEIGRTHNAPFRGRVAAFHPQVTEVSMTASAVMRWLSSQRDSPTADGFMRMLSEEYSREGARIWSDQTRALLSSEEHGKIQIPDCSVLSRIVPVTEFSDTREMAVSLAALCSRATHNDPETIRGAETAAALLWDAREHRERTVESLLKDIGVDTESFTSDDLRAELRGLERTQLEMLGRPVEGAYVYREPEKEHPVSPTPVLITAARCVDRSENWEDAVRQAVSMGGPSEMVAAFTGALAEIRFGEPRLENGLGEVIVAVPSELRERMEAYEGMLSRRTNAPEDMRRLTGSITTAAQREKARSAFNDLVRAVKVIQGQLMEKAGIPAGRGQVRFASAVYPFYDGSSNTVTVYRGDNVMEELRLGSDGMIHVGTGEARIAGVNALSDRDSLKESVMASRSVLSRSMASDPAGRMGEIIASIRVIVNDEAPGLPSEEEKGMDSSEREALQGERNSDALDRDISTGGVSISSKGFNYSPTGERKDAQNTRTVYTIGFSNRTSDEYTGMLSILGVDTVIDVRSVQGSRHQPQFNSETIDNTLYDLGIGYLDGSATMGGRQTAFLDSNGRVDWEQMRASEGYRKSIDGIVDLMSKGHTVAVTCTEGTPLSCHRFGTVARDLQEAGANVMHVMRNGEVLSHVEVEGMMVEKYTSKCLIDDRKSYSEQLKTAYRILNDEHGWKATQSKERSRGRHF